MNNILEILNKHECEYCGAKAILQYVKIEDKIVLICDECLRQFGYEEEE